MVEQVTVSDEKNKQQTVQDKKVYGLFFSKK